MARSGVYEIRNTDTNDFYIGSASDLANRKHQHFTALKANTHHNGHLQNSFNRHGADKFVFRVLFLCDRELLTYYEQLCIDGMKPTYNKRPKAESNLGVKHSEEANARNKQARKGRRLSEEHRRHIGDALTGNQNAMGFQHSEETRQKKSLSMVGKNAGKKPSTLCRERVSESNRTRVVTEETREKMRSAHKGHPMSEEAKRKLSESKKAYYQTLREQHG